MIRLIARCPHCGDGVAVDGEPPSVVFNPDGARGSACPQLAYLLITLEAYEEGADGEIRYVPERSGDWLWEHGRGLRTRRLPEDEPLTGFLLDLAYGHLKRSERFHLRKVRHTIEGAGAEDREDARPGAGCLELTAGGRTLYAELSGWAFYSPQPEEFAAEARRLIAR